MKINIFTSVISILLSALIAYAFYAFSAEEVKTLLCIGSAICMLCTLFPAMGLQLSDTRTAVNMRLLSGLAFLVLLISNIICAVTIASTNVYCLVNGALLLTFLPLLYFVVKSKQ